MPHRAARRFAAALTAVLAAAALYAGFADDSTLPKDSPSRSSDETKSIVIQSDQVVTWSEGNLQILLLRGGAMIQQGLLRAKMTDAVVWLENVEKGKTLPVLVYGEGNVLLERPGDAPQQPQVVLLDLKTRGELRLQNNSRLARTNADAPLYQRAWAERQAMMPQAGPRMAPDIPAVQPAPADRQPSGWEAESGVAAAQFNRPSVGVAPAQSKRPSASVLETGGAALPTDLPQSAPPTRQPPAGPLAGAPPTGRPNRPRRIQAAGRGAKGFTYEVKPLPSGEQVATLSGGVAVYVDEVEGVGVVDISADRAVIWMRDVDAQRFLSGLESGKTTSEHIEIYLEGHVEIRQADTRGPTAGVTRLILADNAYYDISRDVAILIRGEVITQQPGIPAPIHLRAEEIRQTAQGRFEATESEVFATLLPSDPTLKLRAREATVEERDVPRTGIFGIQTGPPATESQLWSTADDIWLRFEDVPILYFPYAQGDLRDPLGPLERVRFRHDRVFGTGILVDWDMYELLGADAPAGTKWFLNTDYLSDRGPALGTEYQTHGNGLLGVPGPYTSLVRAWGIHDSGDKDILAHRIREFDVPQEFRGRALVRHRQEISEELTFLGQFSYLSDRNFLEQYFKREFEEDINQETFAYLKYQHESWAVSALAQPNIRNWVNEPEWLPRVDGYLLGESFFDRFTYFARANAGYSRFNASSDIPDSFFATSFPDEFERTRSLPPSSDFPHTPGVDLGRFDLWQELDLPLQLGPFKVVPYGILDVTHYTETLLGDDDTRLYGGGGVRASIPFTRVYPDVSSELFNLNGIAHKIVFDWDYRYVQSNVDFRELPELDRLDDDATDQARRDMRAYRLMAFPPGSEQRFFATSPFYDPQLYAIRRGLETHVDTLDDLQVLRAGIRQRWQTKRGFPGRQHIIDWMTLDLEGSYFPDSDRDNFGHDFAFLEYDYAWHVGDRTSLLSSAWVDPFDQGASVFNIGVFLDRPERVQYYFGYRKIDPIGSDVVLASTSYTFSPKWAVTVSTGFDFGEERNLGNSFVITRIGSDIQVSVGLSYEALRNNFGITFEVLPTLVPRTGSTLASGRGGALGR